MKHIVIMINCEDEDAKPIIEDILELKVLEQEGNTGRFTLQVDVYNEDSHLVMEEGGTYGVNTH